MKDYTQILAFCLARIDRELKQQRALIEERLGTPISEEVMQDLRSEIIKEATDQAPIKELPPGIIFESHLRDTVVDLKNILEQVESKTGESLAFQYRTLLTRIDEASTSLQEEVSTKAGSEHLHEQYTELRDFNKLADDLQTHAKDTGERLEKISSSVGETVSNIKVDISALSE